MLNFRTLRFIIFVGLLSLSLTFLCANAANLPNLPSELNKTGKATQEYVLLNFYTPDCGTCQAMEPEFKRLEKKLGHLIAFKRLDVSTASQGKYGDLYKITGTPTYILFKKDGTPVYRMKTYISMQILGAQLMRLTGLQAADPLFGKLTGMSSVITKNDFILAAVQPEPCETCEALSPYLNAINFASENKTLGNQKVAVVRLKPTDSLVSQWLKADHLGKGEGYYLYDNASRPVFGLEGTMSPQELWKRIKLFTDMGLN